MNTNVVASILLAAFVIDRIIAALMFVATWLSLPKGSAPEETAKRSEHAKKLVYFLLSGVLGAVALQFIDYSKIDLGPANPFRGVVLWLILVGGADRISEFIGKSEAPAPPPPKQELHLTGKLTLDEESTQQLRNAMER